MAKKLNVDYSLLENEKLEDVIKELEKIHPGLSANVLSEVGPGGGNANIDFTFDGDTADESLEDFLSSYTAGDKEDYDFFKSQVKDTGDTETKVVDTTDGVNDKEFDDLKKAFDALSPEQQKRFLQVAGDHGDVDDMYNEGELDNNLMNAAHERMFNADADDAAKSSNGNALAKLIGSLKF